MTCERYLDSVIVCVTDIQHNDYNYELNAFTHATLHRYRIASSGMHNAGIYNSTERPLDAQLTCTRIIMRISHSEMWFYDVSELQQHATCDGFSKRVQK